MSEFDKAVVAAMLKAREIGVQMLASDCEAILKAAKQSMQGESVFVSGTVLQEVRTNKEVAVAAISPVKKGVIDTPVYTHSPDSAKTIAKLQAENAKLKMAIEYDQADDDAEWEPPHPIFQLAQERDNFMFRVNELEAENEALRKDAERWNAILHSGAYCPSDFGNPIGFSGRLGQYTKEQLNASVDDYISKHCNAAIRQIGGAE